ncbi:thioester reductase domain-containing protein [Candidatus Haliotispira prima]|uniref:Thioester reductase domain-containing protein n=1 Tax=Candidatus Haliotispira prima TaxID=3034016 RepID=A0ABY8ML21_9SPIO|nr:thioester reductase domain-containing protein [Candidatus Haliotispira prima]
MLLHELISDQVRRNPNAPALVAPPADAKTNPEAKPRTLSYAELDRRSDALAGYLQQCGCRPNSIIGIFMETNIDCVVAMLGAMKAGAAYLPLDLAYPELLLGKIIRQTEICVIVTRQRWLPRLASFPDQQILALDAAMPAEGGRNIWENGLYRKELVADMNLDSYAYVVFSSGTTGEPKGIVAPHRGAVHSYGERFRYFQVRPGDHVACNVFFVWEVLRPLMVGGTVYIIPDDLIYDPQLLLDYLYRHQITEILFTPSLLEKVLQSYSLVGQETFEQAFACLKAIWLNGEVVTRNLREKILQVFAPFQDRLQIFNLYSISECHDVALVELNKMREENRDPVCNVGKMMNGVTVHIFRYAADDGSRENSHTIAPRRPDPKRLIPCMPFEQGEVYVSGPTLALGYLKEEQLTAERFIYWQPPSDTQTEVSPGKQQDRAEAIRLYRTGDLGRFLVPQSQNRPTDRQQDNWQRHAEIAIDGRCDSMVKLRGYSVYLGMVEAALRACPGISRAAATICGDEDSEKRLVAYIVRSTAQTQTAQEWQIDKANGFCHKLRELLKAYLPHYMLPNAFVEVDSIPMDPISGKAEYKKLPLPPRPPRPKQDATIVSDDFCRAYRNGELGNTSSDEQSLRGILQQLWARILHLPIEQNSEQNPEQNLQHATFFDLGGHSLLAAELASAFAQVFNRHISVREIYLCPTITEQVRWLQSQDTAGRQEVLEPHLHVGRHMRKDAWLNPQTEEQLRSRKITPVPLSQARHIFITGTTGFLGAFVLAELMAQTKADCQFHCLVRSPDSQTGKKRILDNLASYRLSDKVHRRTLLIAHPGDLSEARMGLSPAEYETLAGQVDLVFHCGSLVNYLYPYQVIKNPTVGGTQAVLALAAQSAAAVHYISTNGIFASGEAQPRFLEDHNIDGYADFLDNGYGQGKWVAEKIVWQAIQAGLPVCIYRPGNLGHSRHSGRYNPNDFQTLIIQTVLRLRCAPLRPENSPWSFEFTPVDFLTECIATFAEEAKQYGEVFNIVENRPLAALSLFEYMQHQGLTDRFLPYEQWLELLRHKAQQTGEKGLLMLSEGLDDVELWLNDSSIYDDRKLRAQRQRPVIDMAYYRQLLETLQQDL